MRDAVVTVAGRLDFDPSWLPTGALEALDEDAWLSILEQAIAEGVFFACVDRVSTVKRTVAITDTVVSHLLDAPDPGVRHELLRRYTVARGRPIQRLAQAVRSYSEDIGERTVARIAKALHEESVEYVIFKGLAVGRRYPKHMLRDSSDVDVLVRDTDAAWRAVAQLEGTGASFEFLDLFAPIAGDTVGTLLGRLMGCAIDLHIRYPQAFGGTTLRADWWRHTEVTALPDSTLVRTLDPELSVILLAAHVQGDGRMRMRDINDLAVLLDAPNLDLERLRHRIDENALNAAFEALIRRLVATYPDEDLRRGTRASGWFERRSFEILARWAQPGRSLPAVPYLAWWIFASVRWRKLPTRSRFRGITLLLVIRLEQDAWFWQERIPSRRVLVTGIRAWRTVLLTVAQTKRWSPCHVPRFYVVRLRRVATDGTQRHPGIVVQRRPRTGSYPRRPCDLAGITLIGRRGEIALTPVGPFVAMSYTGQAVLDADTKGMLLETGAAAEHSVDARPPARADHD